MVGSEVAQAPLRPITVQNSEVSWEFRARAVFYFDITSDSMGIGDRRLHTTNSAGRRSRLTTVES